MKKRAVVVTTARRWIVALIGDVIGNENKLGALTREVLGEAKGPHA